MGQAFLYGNGSGSGAGGILTVTAPAGVTVTITKDGKTKTKIADSSGVAVFKGLATGTWTVTIANGTQTASKPVVITIDYSTTIAFFAATINITYPSGSTCTATDGTTTLTAPDTSGTWTCVVPNAGEWTLACTDGTESTSESVTITTAGQSVSIELSYLLWLYKDGDTCDAVSGGWSNSEHAKTDGSFDGMVTFNQDNMLINTTVAGGSICYGNVFTNSEIDLSEISILNFSITGIGAISSGGNDFNFRLCIASARPTTQAPTFLAEIKILKTGTFSLDVSSINTGYVGIWITTSAKSYAKTTLTVSEIWGEK